MYSSVSDPYAELKSGLSVLVLFLFKLKECIFAVVRQALMQNQAPEIQAKLLAMQRQIQQQQHVVTTPQTVVAKSLLTTPAKPNVSPVTPTPADASRTKKPLTQEQREDQIRLVMRFLLGGVCVCDIAGVCRYVVSDTDNCVHRFVVCDINICVYRPAR